MAKFTAILAVIALAVVGTSATPDKPDGFNIMPQDLMACGSSSRTRLEDSVTNTTSGDVDPRAVDMATFSTTAEAPAYSTGSEELVRSEEEGQYTSPLPSDWYCVLTGPLCNAPECRRQGGRCISIDGYCVNDFAHRPACRGCVCARACPPPV